MIFGPKIGRFSGRFRVCEVHAAGARGNRVFGLIKGVRPSRGVPDPLYIRGHTKRVWICLYTDIHYITAISNKQDKCISISIYAIEVMLENSLTLVLERKHTLFLCKLSQPHSQKQVTHACCFFMRYHIYVVLVNLTKPTNQRKNPRVA